MLVIPRLPKKVQYLVDFSYPFVAKLTEKSAAEKFVGGRPAIDKKLLFQWLLMKKVAGWDFRTTAEMAGVSHPTLIRANELFLTSGVYEQVLKKLIKIAKKEGLIKGKRVALDSSFVKTFSGKQEEGSEGFNGHKKAFGFKLHLLVDAETEMPLSLSLTNGLAHDSTLAIPVLKKAKVYLKEVEYVLADKGYDSDDIVGFIVKELNALASIPINKRNKGKNYTWEAAWRNFQTKRIGRSIKKSIYNKRVSVERVFAQLKRVYHLGHDEVRGILSFAKQVYLSLISYILKRFWTIGISF